MSDLKTALFAEILEVLIEALFMLCENFFIFLFRHEVYNVSSQLTLFVPIILLCLLVYNALKRLLFLLLLDDVLLFLQILSLTLFGSSLELIIELFLLLAEEFTFLLCFLLFKFTFSLCLSCDSFWIQNFLFCLLLIKSFLLYFLETLLTFFLKLLIQLFLFLFLLNSKLLFLLSFDLLLLLQLGQFLFELFLPFLSLLFFLTLFLRVLFVDQSLSLHVFV